jgi:hypothetical protein
MHIKEKVSSTIPWTKPVLEYLDWRKQVIAAITAATMVGW